MKTRFLLLPVFVLAACDDAKKDTAAQGAVKPAEVPSKRMMPPPNSPGESTRPPGVVPAPQVSTVTPEQLQAFGEELQLLEKRLAAFEALPPEQQTKEELEAIDVSHRSLITLRSNLYKGMTLEERKEKLKPFLGSMAKVSSTLMRYRLQVNRPKPLARPPVRNPQADAAGAQPPEGAGEAPVQDVPAGEPEMRGEGNPDPGSADAPVQDVPPQ